MNHAPLAGVLLGTVRLVTVLALALVALALLGAWLGYSALAVPLLIGADVAVLAVVTGAVRVDRGGR